MGGVKEKGGGGEILWIATRDSPIEINRITIYFIAKFLNRAKQLIWTGRNNVLQQQYIQLDLCIKKVNQKQYISLCMYMYMFVQSVYDQCMYFTVDTCQMAGANL